MVVPYLHSAWSLPFDAVFLESRVSGHGMAFDLIYLMDIMIESFCAHEASEGESAYFRTTKLYDKKLGSSFIVDSLCLVSHVFFIVTPVESSTSLGLFFSNKSTAPNVPALPLSRVVSLLHRHAYPALGFRRRNVIRPVPLLGVQNTSAQQGTTSQALF